MNPEAFIGPPPPYEHWEWISVRTPYAAWSWEDPTLPLWYDQDTDSAFFVHHNRWSEWRRRQYKKTQRAERAALIHPLWNRRQHTCAVHVEVVPSSRGLRANGKPRRSHPGKHSKWERQTAPCRARVCAWDVTDPRALGYLYGACPLHLRRAMEDDPSRIWRWHDGRLVSEIDLDAELSLFALSTLGR